MSESKIFKATGMLMHTGRLHKAMIDARVKDIGIHRTQHRILMHLARHEKLPSQKELAEHLDITPAAVTGALKKIEHDGYVERTLGHDNRYMELRITDKGRALVQETKRLFSEADASIFEGFSDEELDLYISSLEKLESNIKKQHERNESK